MSKSKQVAVLQGEMDGLVCKLNGYERALQDCELQVGSALPYILFKAKCATIMAVITVQPLPSP
jgi:hypothetical protein